MEFRLPCTCPKTTEALGVSGWLLDGWSGVFKPRTRFPGFATRKTMPPRSDFYARPQVERRGSSSGIRSHQPGSKQRTVRLGKWLFGFPLVRGFRTPDPLPRVCNPRNHASEKRFFRAPADRAAGVFLRHPVAPTGPEAQGRVCAERGCSGCKSRGTAFGACETPAHQIPPVRDSQFPFLARHRGTWRKQPLARRTPCSPTLFITALREPL